MKIIKRLIFFLLVPPVMYGQTVHIDEDRIVYKGTVSVANVNKDELYGRAKDAIKAHVKGSKKDMGEDNTAKEKITVDGTIRLVTPWHIIRKAGYILELSAEDGNYKYRIDSVYLEQKERGEKAIKISSEQLFKGIEATGPESIEAEKILNEIDMNFQKLLALINKDMKMQSAVKTR